jgi:NTE family protein
MTSLSSAYSSTVRQSHSMDVTKFLIPRARLEKIAHVFGISEEKIHVLKNNDWHLQNKCFKKVVYACECNEWEKINSVRELIFGIKNSKGQSVCEILTNIEDAPPNFCTHPPENLVFQGGGPKGIAYIGVIEVLEERNIMSSVKRVAGTSAGAITATLIAMGYSSAEIRELLTSKALTEFLDFTCSAAGICRGEDFLYWINSVIEAKIGIPNCTFRELKQELRKGRKLKHLHIFAIKVGNNKEAIQFNSEDKKWDNLVIADAVRASMSLPAIFPPHTLHFKDVHGRRIPDSLHRSFMDGGISGMLFNLPIEAFDKNRYVRPGLSENGNNYLVTNRRTLAFSLYTPGKKIQKKDTRVECCLEAYCEWKRSEKEAVLIYIKTKLHDEDRIVHISNCRIRTDDFSLSKEKMQEAIDSGQAATRSFFLTQEEKLSRFQAFERGYENIHFQPPRTNNFYYVYKNTKGQKFLLGVEVIGDNITFHSDYSYSLAPLSHLSKDQFSFSRLAELDDRFSIFIHLRNNELEKADKLYGKHKSFYKKCFYWNIFRKLIIERNHPEYLNFFMSKGFTFKIPKNTNLDSLWYAYSCGAHNSFKVLLKDPSIDLRITEANSNKTLLYFFSKEGQMDLVQLFCAEFRKRHPESYKALLDHEVNSSEGIKKTAFVIALEKRNFKIAKFLINEGADYLKFGPFLLSDKYECCGKSMGARYFLFKVLSGDIKRVLSPMEKFEALRFCLTYHRNGGNDREHEHDSEADIWRYTEEVGGEFAEKLIRKKIINSPIEDIRDSKGNGLLLMIMKSEYSKKDYLVQLLLSGRYSPHVNQVNVESETPLNLAARKNDSKEKNINIFRHLLARNEVDVNYQNAQGNTALHYAVLENNKRHMQALLARRNINPNIRNNLGRTPLHLAARQDIIDLLIKAGGNDRIKDNNGMNSQSFRAALKKPQYESLISNFVGGVYKDIHESDSSMGIKILEGTLFTLFQPILFPLAASADFVDSIKHSLSDDGSFCKCASCKQQRNIHNHTK